MTDSIQCFAKVDSRALEPARRSCGHRSASSASAPAERASPGGAQDRGSADALFFKALLDHSADMIAGLGDDGTIVYVTPHAPRLGGGRARIGREWLSLWPEACARALRDPLFAALDGVARKALVSCPDVAGRAGW